MSNTAKRIIEGLAEYRPYLDKIVDWNDFLSHIKLLAFDAHELLASGAEITTNEPKLEKAFVSRPSLAAKRHNPDEISVLRLSKDYGEWLITPMLAKQFLDVYGVAIDPGSGDVYMLEQATTIGKKYICRKGT